MPEKKTVRSAQKAKREGKSGSTQAGAYVREEMEHFKQGKHGRRVKSRKQAIAIGLSKARRAGVKAKPPKKGQSKPSTRQKAKRDLAKGRTTRSKSGATTKTKKSSSRSTSRKSSNSTRRRTSTRSKSR
jgi:hypothetical protein